MAKNNKEVVLITGASAGIGKCCAEQLAGKGWQVYGVSRKIEETLPNPAFIVKNVDVTDECAVAQLVNTIVEREGRLDAVINCAGFTISGAFEDTSDAEARRQFDTNFFGAATVCRTVLPIMRAQGRGKIVNVSSIAGIIPIPFQAYYSSSKAALTALTRALRLEVEQLGIHVVAVEPGDYHTEFTQRREVIPQAGTSAYADAFARALGVIQAHETNAAPPDDVALLVDRILHRDSPRSSYLTGPWFQRFAVFIRPHVPAGLFDWGVSKIYKLK